MISRSRYSGETGTWDQLQRDFRTFFEKYPEVAATLGADGGVRRQGDSIGFPLAARLLEKLEKSVPALSFDLPRVLGKYVLLEELARGGMGVVYRARQTGLDRDVALKLIQSGHLATEDEVDQFRGEARAVASLHHPAIIPNHDFGEVEGFRYIAMTLLEGGNLEARVRDRGLTTAATAEVVETIARAVHFAHTRGIIHCDLKPANIVFDTDSRPFVTDFGLATTVDRSRAGAGEDIAGTLRYMAPERALGEARRPGPVVDVYSLGAVLYEGLTGRPVFRDDSLGDVLRRLLVESPVPPREIEASVPLELESICLKCLEKDPGRRYASAAELAEDIARFRRGEPVQARSAGAIERLRKWTRRKPSVAAFVALLLLVTLCTPTALFWHNAQLRHRGVELEKRQRLARRYLRAARLSLAARAVEQGQYTRARELLAPRAPDAADPPRRFGWRHLWRRSHPEFRSLESFSSGVGHVRFRSPRLLSAADFEGTLRLYDVLDGAVVSEARHRVQRRFHWPLSDGRELLLQNEPLAPGLHRVTAWRLATAGGETTLRREHAFEVRDLSGYSVSPDEARLFVGTTDGAVRVLDTRTWKETAVLTDRHGLLAFPVVSHSGRFLASCGRERDIVIADASDLRTIRRLHDPEGYTGVLAVSPDDRLLVALDGKRALQIWDTGSWRRTGSIETGASRIFTFQISPDGRTLALSLEREQPVVELWDLERKTFRRAFPSPDSKVSHLAFSPDGRLLATGRLDGALLVWDLDEPTEPARFERRGDRFEALALSPGGDAVVAVRRHFVLERFRLVRRGRTTSAEPSGVLVLEEGVTQALCPDGGVAALGRQDGSVRLLALEWEAEPPGCRELTTLPGEAPAAAIAFSPSSRQLAVADSDGRVALWMREGAGDTTWRRRRSIFTGTGDASDLAVSPDGAFVAVARERRPTVTLCRLAEAAQPVNLAGHREWVIALAFSPDSKLLATGGLDRMILLWNIDELETSGELEASGDPRPLRILRGHTDAVTSLTFLPGGDVIASGSDDRSIKLWDANTGTEQMTLNGHRHHVNALGLSADGSLLVSAGGRRASFGDILFWSAKLRDGGGDG